MPKPHPMRERAYELADQGASAKEIAAACGVKLGTANFWKHEAKIRRGEPIVPRRRRDAVEPPPTTPSFIVESVEAVDEPIIGLKNHPRAGPQPEPLPAPEPRRPPEAPARTHTPAEQALALGAPMPEDTDVTGLIQALHRRIDAQAAELRALRSEVRAMKAPDPTI